MNDARLAVIGTGSIGSIALWNASKMTDGVIGFEAQTPGHTESAVGGDSRLFRTSYKDETPYHQMLQDSLEQWRELEQESGQDILHQCGGVYIGHPEENYLPALLASIKKNGLNHELLSAEEIRTRFPGHGVEDDEQAIFEPDAGFLKTHAAVSAATNAATERGAHIISQSPIDEVTETSNGVRITSGDRTWTADRVIIAAGSGSKPLLPLDVRPRVHVRRIMLTWFMMKTGKLDLFTPENFPIFVHILRGQGMYGAPTLDNYMVKATLDDRSIPLDEFPHDFYTLSPQEKLETLELIERFFPELEPSIVRYGTYPDLYSADKKALVGLLPGSERTFLATGFSGTGFKMAASAGAAIARLAVQDEQKAVPEYWDPARPTGLV